MIVKNESKVIERCLASVKPLIDYWVIVDTGSSDSTKKLVRSALKDIPGELHERPWVDFSHNRNEALELAKGKGDYLLLIDADEWIEYKESLSIGLDKDLYYIPVLSKNSKYLRAFLVNNWARWEYKGVLHEQFLAKEEGMSSEILQGLVNHSISEEGARGQDPKKFEKDARVLEDALQKDPHNREYVFYLAQSYANANNGAKAQYYYEMRSRMGGCPQCVYYSYYVLAVLQDIFFRADRKKIEEAYWMAYEIRPTRAEPLYRLAEYYLRIGDLDAARWVADLGRTIPLTDDGLNVEEWIYTSGFHELKERMG
ncbi:MAG: glycosyltransferase [Verrucomicrobia bacterium]|nr:glycosyltransferase [Verrucomicrobiota bacterium]